MEVFCKCSGRQKIAEKKPARIHSPDPFLRAESKPEFPLNKLVSVLRILSPENSFGKTESELKPRHTA